MIKHIVLDMGGVLTDWDPARFMQTLGLAEEDAALLLREIFGETEWPLQDLGLMSEEETFRRVRARIPERLGAVAGELIFHWEKLSLPVPGMAEALHRLKRAGCGIWLLSNASLRHGQYWNRIPGSECFDGLVVSAYEGAVKPDSRLYQTLLKRFGLEASECVFIDDVPINAAGAIAAGMDAFVFRDCGDMLRQLRERGVNV